MSTMGIPSLIGELSPQPKHPSRPMLAQQSPHWSCTLELTPLGLHHLQSELVGWSGDVLPVAMSSYMITNRQIRWWRANPATTGHVHRRTPVPWTGDHAHLWTIHLFLPTCSTEHAPPRHVQDTSSHPMTWSVQKTTSLSSQITLNLLPNPNTLLQLINYTLNLSTTLRFIPFRLLIPIIWLIIIYDIAFKKKVSSNLFEGCVCPIPFKSVIFHVALVTFYTYVKPC